MIRPIVVPLDGSVFAARALPLARSVAARWGAPLHLVRVHDTGPAPRRLLMRGHVQTSVAYEDRRLRTTASRQLDEVAEGVAAELGEERVIRALLEGPVGGTLAAYCERVEAGLVVMSSRRRPLIDRLLDASTAEHVLRETGVPVLAVDGEVEAEPLANAFQRIVVPVDGNDHSTEVIDHALSLGDQDRTRYTLVRVVPPGFVGDKSQMGFPRIDPAIGETDLGEQAKRDLERQAAAIRSRGYQVDTRLEPSYRPAERIVQVAAEVGADLIALATRRRGLATRVLFGSVATHVAQNAASPVLVYCPRPAEARKVEAALGGRAPAKRPLTVAG